MNHKQMITTIKEVLLAMGYEHTIIHDISYNDSMIQLIIQLPYHKEYADIEEITNNLKEELNAYDVKIVKQIGKKLTIHFGRNDLGTKDEPLLFSNKFIHENTLKIELPSAFGSTILDFSDGASCHLLNGGTTRMGKTTFLLYLSTLMYIQTNGKAHIYITSTKAKDYYPFNHLPNCQISQSHAEFNLMLDEIIQEYKQRNALLYSPALEKATDAKGVKKLYPHLYHLFQPIFVIIDEFSRFSDNAEIQNKVTELVETAGFVNVHVIISTTRPDAKTVLKPRIKANLLARICFTTADTNNSIVILDKEGAENLGRIEGRAIFLNSETNIIQVPYMSYGQCEQLLQPYKKECITNDKPNHKESQRQTNNELTNKIQNLFEESVSSFDIQEQHQSNQRMQSNNEAPVNGWMRLASQTDKR